MAPCLEYPDRESGYIKGILHFGHLAGCSLKNVRSSVLSFSTSTLVCFLVSPKIHPYGTEFSINIPSDKLGRTLYDALLEFGPLPSYALSVLGSLFLHKEYYALLSPFTILDVIEIYEPAGFSEDNPIDQALHRPIKYRSLNTDFYY
jgi:hypothetical protein